jgi:SulP family sulfate permease
MKEERAFLSIADWMKGYSPAGLRLDGVAGLTAAAVVIPKAMACAVIAGLPVQAGLYTALAALLVYPLFGSSRVLSVTTTSTLALMTAAAVGVTSGGASPADPLAVGGTLALLVGAFLVLARILRLGFLANFISKPVLVGFEAGIGVVIAVSQLKSILGVHVASKTTVGTLLELPGLLSQTHLLTLGVAAVGILLLVGLPRLVPRVPASLVLVVLSVLAAALFSLGERGVSLVGAVPSGLPLPHWPGLDLVSRLWPVALGLALMSFTESVASARTFIRREDPPVQPDRELVAIGAANLAVACFGGFPAGGGTSQTAVNARAGARSQGAQWVAALVVVVCLLVLSKAIGLLPQAALGALVFVVALSMIKPEKFRAIGRIRRDELAWAFVTMAGVVLVGTLEGILVAVAISILTLFYQANHPRVYALAYNREKDVFRRAGEHAGDETVPGLLLMRTEGRLTFANAANAGDKMKALVDQANPRVIVLECSAIPDIEYTALVMLTEAEEKLRDRGITLWLAALNPDLFTILERSPLGRTLGRERLFFDLHKALEAYGEREGKKGDKPV